ncbi:hypothetical protein G6O67_006874 [Ophiocordyceps sinensis]|uniref:Uncharacterized protein n=1 Tax=Ophiocordyceps sinensis TaxID=72228 RepID=A0A8H4LWM3_9HYPO|nr:hypothetical protein G6O67_006874 [Ophiocordyceps sinensis]
MDAVLEPTPKERAFYYAGLPSSPKLVARSSSEPSYLRLDEWGNPICKKLHIVGDHPIIAKWNDDAPTSPRAQVVDLLSACNVDWHAIDVLRIGDLDARIASVMLFISVEPDSLSWQTGRAVAMQCRLILLHHDLPDVHCEIKESRLVPLTSPKVLQLPGHDMAMRYADRRRMLCDLVGNIISAEDTPTKQGTSCIYLREAGTNAVYALTCRHVCFGPEEEEQLIPGTALSQSSAALKKCIMQPGGGTFDKVLRDLDEFEQHHARKLEEFEQRAGIEDEDRRMRKVQFQQYSLASIQPILADFQARRQPGTRVIGQVAYVRDDFGDNCNIKRAIDVTYTTPMEWILEDFRACGLDLDIVSRLPLSRGHASPVPGPAAYLSLLASRCRVASGSSS